MLLHFAVLLVGVDDGRLPIHLLRGRGLVVGAPFRSDVLLGRRTFWRLLDFNDGRAEGDLLGLLRDQRSDLVDLAATAEVFDDDLGNGLRGERVRVDCGAVRQEDAVAEVAAVDGVGLLQNERGSVVHVPGLGRFRREVQDFSVGLRFGG